MMFWQVVAEKAVPVTDAVVDQHLKPFIDQNAEEIQKGVKDFAENELLPAAQKIQEDLPGLAEQFTEGQLKPGAQKLAHDIEVQASIFFSNSPQQSAPENRISKRRRKITKSNSKEILFHYKQLSGKLYRDWKICLKSQNAM